MSTMPPLASSHTVRGACPHDCPDTCALLTTVENGVAIRVQGNPEHSHTDGRLCTKVSRYTERTYHPERILESLRRVGPKGSGQFESVNWNEALDPVAARWDWYRGRAWPPGFSTGSAPPGWNAPSAPAHVSNRARPGMVNGLDIWWRKLRLDGSNINQLTSQRVTDTGNGRVFYDRLVEIEPPPAAA